MDKIKELEDALEELKKEIEDKRRSRQRTLRSFYDDYISNSKGELTIKDDESISRKKCFRYWLDKGYLKITTQLPTSNEIGFRLTADGIDYIENLRISELESDINKEKEKMK